MSGIENKYDQHKEQQSNKNQQRNKPSSLVYWSSRPLASCNDKEKTLKSDISEILLTTLH